MKIRTIEVDLDDIIVGPLRHSFDRFQELKHSISKQGLLSPPHVEVKGVLYRVIPGEGTARIHACNELNITKIPVCLIEE